MGIGECGTNVENLDSIISKFNSHICRKLFVHIKELKGTSSDGSKNIYDKMETLKSMVTDNTIEMERKFQDKVNVDNYAKFAGVGNKDIPIPIRLAEDDKERYVIFLCSDKRLGDYEYFTKIKKIMADEDNVLLAQETADHFLTYLLNYKIPINIYRDIPITETYQEIMSISVQQEQQFVNLLKSGDYKFDIPVNHNFEVLDKNYLVRKLDLFIFYIEYCKKIGCGHASKETFWLRIKGLISEFRDRRNGADVTYYLISECWVLLYIPINNTYKSQKSLLTVEESNSSIVADYLSVKVPNSSLVY